MPTLSEIPMQLEALQQRQRLRTRVLLQSSAGRCVQVHDEAVSKVSFASNDYLGLTHHPEVVAALVEGVRSWGAGSGASALLGGYFVPHHQLETRFASFMGFEAARLFGDGFLANLGVIPALIGRGGAIFADRLNHLSLNAGSQLSRAKFYRFRHNNVEHLSQLLSESAAPVKLIAVDAVYSMDGDQAPLAELLALAEQYDAWLYVDDAHGFGVMGCGRGTLWAQGVCSMVKTPSPRLILMATLGKAGGVSGAIVAGSALVMRWLDQAAATAIYTTAPPPALSCALLKSLDIIEHEVSRRAHLQRLIGRFRAGSASLPWEVLPSETAVQALILGEDGVAVAVSDALRREGLWVPAIRPPTVPEGTARLRVSLSAAHSIDDVDRLLMALHRVAAEGRF